MFKSVTGTFEGYVTFPLYLYNKGTWNNVQTEGITETWIYSSSKFEITKPHIAETTTHIRFWINRNINDPITVQYNCNARFNSTVNLTNYKYLKLNVSSVGDFGCIYLGISKSSNLQSHSYDAVYSETSEVTGIKIVDISKFSGEYYIYMGFETTLEKTGDDEYYIDQIFLSNT